MTSSFIELTAWLAPITLIALSIAGIVSMHKLYIKRQKHEREIPAISINDTIDQAVRQISKVAEKGHLTELRASLPLGWEVGVTIDGNIYYIDHNAQITRWDHPTMTDAELERLQFDTESLCKEKQPVLPICPANGDDLPEGWEAAVTGEGIPYYINHITKQTTWVDPRTHRPSVASTQAVYLLAQLKQERFGRRSSWSSESDLNRRKISDSTNVHTMLSA